MWCEIVITMSCNMGLAVHKQWSHASLHAGFQSHAHLQAGLLSLAGTPEAVMSFLDQAHTASRHQVCAGLSIAPPPHPPAGIPLLISHPAKLLFWVLVFSELLHMPVFISASAGGQLQSGY